MLYHAASIPPLEMTHSFHYTRECGPQLALGWVPLQNLPSAEDSVSCKVIPSLAAAHIQWLLSAIFVSEWEISEGCSNSRALFGVIWGLWGNCIKVQLFSLPNLAWSVFTYGESTLSLSLFFFWPCRVACGILVPWPGFESGPPAVKALHPNPWTAREFPESTLEWASFI